MGEVFLLWLKLDVPCAVAPGMEDAEEEDPVPVISSADDLL